MVFFCNADGASMRAGPGLVCTLQDSMPVESEMIWAAAGGRFMTAISLRCLWDEVSWGVLFEREGSWKGDVRYKCGVGCNLEDIGSGAEGREVLVLRVGVVGYLYAFAAFDCWGLFWVLGRVKEREIGGSEVYDGSTVFYCLDSTI